MSSNFQNKNITDDNSCESVCVFACICMLGSINALLQFWVHIINIFSSATMEYLSDYNSCTESLFMQ